MKLLFEAIQEYDDVQLLQYLQEKVRNKKGSHREVMQKVCTYNNSKKYDGYYSKKGLCTSLQYALFCDKSKEVMSELIYIGGRDLVMEKDDKAGRRKKQSTCGEG